MVAFSNTGVTAKVLQILSDDKPQVRLNVDPTATTESAGSAHSPTPQKAANIYVITGSSLTGLKILIPPVRHQPEPFLGSLPRTRSARSRMARNHMRRISALPG
jgi:hypothetical protein